MLAAATLAGLGGKAAVAQPDWLPPDFGQRGPAAGPALAPDDPCADPMLGPIAPPMVPSGLDQARAACLVSEGSLTAVSDAALEGSGLHGTFDSGLLVRASGLLVADLQLSAQLRAPSWQWIRPDGGAASSSDVGVGPLSLGASSALGRDHHLLGHPLRLTWALAVDVPWTDSAADDPVLAAAPEVRASLGLAPDLAAHARVLALLVMTRPTGDIDTERAVALSTDVAWRPVRALALAAGAEGQGGLYGGGLDHLLVRGGARLGLGGALRVSLGASVNLAGDEPIDVAVALALARDL